MANQEELFSKWLVTTRCGSLTGVCTLYTRESSQLTYLILSRGDTQQKSTQHPTLAWVARSDYCQWNAFNHQCSIDIKVGQ